MAGGGELVGVGAVDQAEPDEHRDPAGDLARKGAHDCLALGGIGHLGDRDRYAPPALGQIRTPGGPHVAGPVGLRECGYHVAVAVDGQR